MELCTNSYHFISKAGGCHAASFSSCYRIAELETFLGKKYFELGKKLQNEKWVLLFFYLCHIMTALNMLNNSMQRECHTMIDFADKVCALKEKLELWFVKKVCFLSNFEQIQWGPWSKARFIHISFVCYFWKTFTLWEKTLKNTFKKHQLLYVNKKSIQRKCSRFWCRISFWFSGTFDWSQ